MRYLDRNIAKNMSSLNSQYIWLDEIADLFNHPATILWRSIEVKCIKSYLSRNSVRSPVMDLGCGGGEIGQVVFGNDNLSLIGMDNWEEMTRKAIKSKVYSQVVVGDGCRLPFKNESFGTVFSNSVIEHIEDLNSVLVETKRVLKDGGVFIFTTPSHKFGEYLFFYCLFKSIGLNRLSMWYKDTRNRLLNHFNCFSSTEWEKKLNLYGFHIVESKYYLPKVSIWLWDILAAGGFILRKIAFWNNFEYGRRVSYSIVDSTSKAMKKIIKNIFLRFYNKGFPNNEAGGGLLIIAQKP